jgi:hypothetical protein
MTRAIVVAIPSPSVISAPSETDRALADVRARLAPGKTIGLDPEADRVRIALLYRLRLTDSTGRAPARHAQFDDSYQDVGVLAAA